MIGLDNLTADFAKDLIELVNSLKKLPKSGKVKQTYESKKTGKELTKEFKYVQLDTILDKIKENNNFALLQPICFDKEQNKNGVKCILIHKSGQRLESEIFPLKDKEKIQDEGAEITYRRRYALGSFLGIATEDDIDGPRPNSKSNEPLTNEQMMVIAGLSPELKEQIVKVYKKDFTELTKDEAIKVIDSLKKNGLIKSKEELEKIKKEKEEVF